MEPIVTDDPELYATYQAILEEENAAQEVFEEACRIYREAKISRRRRMCKWWKLAEEKHPEIDIKVRWTAYLDWSNGTVIFDLEANDPHWSMVGKALVQPASREGGRPPNEEVLRR